VNYQTSTILYVDDEIANLTAFRYAFEDRFTILTASSGQAALEILADRRVSVLLADQRMPGMTGAELCDVVRERYPEVVRMIVTAYSEMEGAVAAIERGQVSRYIVKPWREEAMVEVLRSAIEAYQLGVLTRDLQARLLRSEQQTTYVLGRVLHELSSPSASLLINLRWMADTLAGLGARNVPAELASTLAELRSASDEAVTGMTELVRRIERFKRGEPRANDPSMRTEVRRAIEAAVAIVNANVRKRARVVVETEPVAPVAADPTQVSQVLVNLIINASEAFADPTTPERNVITVRARPGEKGGVTIEVEDNGTGIDAALLPRIFDPFVSTKGEGATRGFGLAVVRETITALGGEISVASTVGVGTRFTITFPAARQ
jgi:signal transduction histidine kinase